MDPDGYGLVDALVQASFTTMAVLNKAAADHHLSLTQLRVVGILADRRLRVTDLAAYLGLEKSTMSGLIDRAERRGILERLPSETDGRAVDVTLTPAGRALADRIHARVRAGLSPMTGGLTAAERARLRGLLEKILMPNGSSRLP